MTRRPGPRPFASFLVALAALALFQPATMAGGAGGEARTEESRFAPARDPRALPADLQARLDLLLERALPVTVRVILPDASGSGVVVSDDGLILTAAHVAKQAGKQATIVFGDGRTEHAVTLGGNSSRDSALLRMVDVDGLPHVELPPPGRLEPGGWCVGLGFPRGGVEGEPAVARLGLLKDVAGRFLLTDCALISGDSGGPLFDLDGQLIGIHSRIEQDVATNYHVPLRSFRLAWERLLAGERWSASRALLGLLDVRSVAGGARAGELMPEGPAERGGLLEGDVIRTLNGEAVYGADELRRLLTDLAPEQTIALAVRRADEPLELEVTLGDRGQGRSADVRVGDGGSSAPIGLGRESRPVRAELASVTKPHAASVARVVVDGRQRAIATVVDAEGYLISKASELSDDPVCVLSDGRALPALVVARDPYYDLALLRVEARELSPVLWERDPITLGRVVVAAGPTGDVLGVGVVGVTPRAITGGQGKLGLVLAFGVEEALVAKVNADTPADLAGVEVGDRLVRIGSEEVESRAHAKELLRAFEAGDAVRLEFLRDGVRILMAPVLAARSGSGANPGGGRRWGRERLEGDRSDLRGGFPSALQHDVVLAPSECGGPLFDLEGRAVGLNIARVGRVASYAVPAERIDVLVASLRRRAQELVSDER